MDKCPNLISLIASPNITVTLNILTLNPNRYCNPTNANLKRLLQLKSKQRKINNSKTNPKQCFVSDAFTCETKR